MSRLASLILTYVLFFYIMDKNIESNNQWTENNLKNNSKVYLI